MQSTRLLGPPRLFWVMSAIIALVTLVDLTILLSEYRFLFAGLAVVVIWRIMRIGVFLEGEQVVVRNMIKTRRFFVGDVDIRPLVTDPSMKGDDDPPDRSTAEGDLPPRIDTRYVLAHGADHHEIEALMGRSAADHAREALALREAIIDAAGDHSG